MMIEDKRCPVCGVGVLRHLGTEAGDVLQAAEVPIGETYSCGHELAGPTLATADAERLEVERRTSEETVDRVDAA
jgi:hypothetical protein